MPRIKNNLFFCTFFIDYTLKMRMLISMDKISKDKFVKAGRDKDYYIAQLKQLGCSEDLLGVIADLTPSRKKIAVQLGDDTGAQNVKWDGHSFYFYECWGAGEFNRVQFDPSNGYIDFGFGHNGGCE